MICQIGMPKKRVGRAGREVAIRRGLLPFSGRNRLLKCRAEILKFVQLSELVIYLAASTSSILFLIEPTPDASPSLLGREKGWEALHF